MAALALGRSTRWLLMHHSGIAATTACPGCLRATRAGSSRGLAPLDRLAGLDAARGVELRAQRAAPPAHGRGARSGPHRAQRRVTPRSGAAGAREATPAWASSPLTWRAFYYAPKTLKAWLGERRTREEGKRSRATRARCWLRCYAPYALLHSWRCRRCSCRSGPGPSCRALVNSLGAEALTNLHTFLVVGPNHTGDDLYRFDVAPALEGRVRRPPGARLGELRDRRRPHRLRAPLAQLPDRAPPVPGHPDAPVPRVQPKVKALCEKYGIPYVQESVFTRAKKMVAVAVGRASMKRADDVGRAPRDARPAALRDLAR